MQIPFRPALVGFLLTALIVSACSVRTLNRKLVLPEDRQTLDHDSPFLKVHLKNGSLLVLSEWIVDDAGSRVTGHGRLYGPRRTGGTAGTLSAPLDSVALFETNTTGISKSIIPLTVFTGASLALTAYCISNPKACFGSCPTFYVDNGSREVLRAEGFSASIAPSLEGTDLDALVDARPRDGWMDVTMVNEALETHVVRHVDLLAVPRPPGERIFADARGRFWRTAPPVVPTTARGPEGDCRELLRALDQRERFSEADSLDLSTGEVLELEFVTGPGTPKGLLIGSRQTLLSTYLFYQTLAYMGSEAGHWLSVLERHEKGTRDRFSGVGEILGGIEVWIPQGESESRWVLVGEIQEHGPLATDLTLVPLPGKPADRVRVQLRMTRGKHRLDYVALVDLIEETDPVRLAPRGVRYQGDSDTRALGLLVDPGQSLVTLPGDRYVLSYRLPDTPEDWELFLESRGYYLEWIREPWLAEESAAHLAEVLFAPEQALRRMAPEYKTVEAEMEAVFWSSQYARP